MKRLLVVAYHYPPESGSSGVLRTLKFTKYLGEFGWRPHVLTAHPSLYRFRDPALMADIPESVVIHRSLALDSTRHLALRGRYLGVTAIPDAYQPWIPFGIVSGIVAAARYRIDAIYSTSPPPSAHLVAAGVQAVARVPWIADFRDPWIEEDYPHPSKRIRRGLEQALERLVTRRSTRVLATTPGLRRDFLRRYPELGPDRVRVVFNGFDEADFAGKSVAPRTDRFTLLHAGLVTKEFRDPLPLLEAAARLLHEGSLPADRFQVAFIGGGGYVKSRAFKEAVAALRLGEDVVSIRDRLPYDETLQRVGEAGALLLLQDSDDTRGLIPAKAFEYLRSGRPILALTPRSDTEQLLQGKPGCHVVDPSDRTALRNVLEMVYHQWEQAPSMQFPRALAAYERRSLTGELASLLDEVTG